jgi:AraC-like DNA-binding protein
MDALSDVLKVVKLAGGVFLNVEFTNPWSIETPPQGDITQVLAPGAGNLVLYHFVAEGACWAKVPGAPATRLGAGELVMIPGGDSHILASDPQLAPVPIASILRPPGPGEVVQLRHGGGGATTRIVCGFLACDSLGNPLAGALPRLLTLGVRGSSWGGWIESTLALAAQETGAARAGSVSMLAKLSELLFVEAVRRYVESLPPASTGWLAGLRDPLVGKALALLHAQPAREWTVEQLGREVGLSRSALSERFGALVGQPPMQYLVRWRMRLAADRLRSDERGIARIAEEVGYESEAAFNRAFKREFGVPPAKWRRGLDSNRSAA